MLFVLHASSGQWIERSSHSFKSRSVDYGEEMFLDMIQEVQLEKHKGRGRGEDLLIG